MSFLFLCPSSRVEYKTKIVGMRKKNGNKCIVNMSEKRGIREERNRQVGGRENVLRVSARVNVGKKEGVRKVCVRGGGGESGEGSCMV